MKPFYPNHRNYKNQKKLKRITFIHLLNDFSGSPLVLANVIKGLRDKGHHCTLMTSEEQSGFLSAMEGVVYRSFSYRFFNDRLLRLIAFFWSQVVLFYRIFAIDDDEEIIYINTLLPFGAAIGGKLSGKQVVYHIHETSVKPLILKRFLKWIAQKCATKAIYVSDYLKSTEPLPNVDLCIVHNALSDSFVNQAATFKEGPTSAKPFEVLMLCSLKAYKGVHEFVTLAKRLPSVRFNLVLNAKRTTIDQYFRSRVQPANLTLFPCQEDVHPFYQSASLVLNLSHPEQWIETFGMTLLEGMAYGLPCIVPQVGGPAELVQHGINGYRLDQRDLDTITMHITRLIQDPALYQILCHNASLRARDFAYKTMLSAINAQLLSLAPQYSTKERQDLIY